MTLYPWQTTIYDQITTAFLQGRGHHALLFKTEVGLGTTQLIQHFAHWLLCQSPQQAQPCGQCKSCLLWQSGNHPDFHLLQSVEGKDIGVDQVRELTEKLHQFSQQGGNAVVYIAGAERLTEAGANALLKTLEEPSDKVYFLLEAPLQSAMLATIQSRCQLWVVHTPDFEQVYHWLQTQFPTCSEQDLATALRISHYRPLLCKNLLESDRLPLRKAFLRTFWKFYESRDVWLLFSVFDKEKEQILQQLAWLDSFFCDSLKANLGIEQDWINHDIRTGIIPFSQTFTAQGLLKGHQIIQQAQRDLQEINAVNQELILMECLTRLVLEVFEV